MCIFEILHSKNLHIYKYLKLNQINDIDILYGTTA